MKFLASVVATLAIANPVPADEPAPASDGTQMDTSIIMINMNRADIQVSVMVQGVIFNYPDEHG